MLFSEDEACTYAKNPLLEVICQLRFPPILSINENTPAEFQEAVRDMFPQFSVQVERVPVMPRSAGTGKARNREQLSVHFR